MKSELEHPPRVRERWHYRFTVLDESDEVPGQLTRDDRDGWEAVSFSRIPEEGAVKVLQRRSLIVHLEEPAPGL